MFFGHQPSLHLIGIGGSGMSGIAEVLLALGFDVSGSDVSESSTVKRLQKLGARISIGHKIENIVNPSCVVVSSAISPTNPEWVEAMRRGIPVIARAEMLAELMRLKMGIAVAGSHGKTTTTSMMGQILRPLDPTVVVGGRLQHWNASSVVGKGPVFVIEADESDRSFLKFSPVHSIVTNVDREHLDTYKDLDDIENTFVEFLDRTAFFGMNWVSADCESLTRIRPRLSKPTKTYGFSFHADLKISEARFEKGRSFFRLSLENHEVGEFELPVVGRHNVSNAAGAIGVALSIKVPLEKIQEGCRQFIPADRRLQIHCETPDRVVIEDYGHHPTEIAATLDAIRILYPQERVHVVFQPHRYTRTAALFDDFGKSFEGRCHQVILLPIYAAHEKEISGISSESLARTFRNVPTRVLKHVPNANEVCSYVEGTGRQIILVLGAAPLTSLATKLAEVLKTSARERSSN